MHRTIQNVSGDLSLCHALQKTLDLITFPFFTTWSSFAADKQKQVVIVRRGIIEWPFNYIFPRLYSLVFRLLLLGINLIVTAT